jgi:hypothetical protein
MIVLLIWNVRETRYEDAVIGFFASCLYVLLGRGSRLRLTAVTFAASLALNGAGLINWAHIGDFPPSFVLVDFALIAAYTLIGCVIGVLPALALSALWQWFRRRVAAEQ